MGRLMAELLLELFCEEIPARMQRDAAELLRKNIAEKFTASGLSFEMLNAYVTPRRLILHAIGLPTRTPDISEEKRGPKIDAPEQAIAGFLKSTGLTRSDLTQRADGKATFFYATIEQSGRPSADVIADIVPAVVRGFAWPKSMRWGERSASMDALRWVRPLQSIVCLLDGEVVPFEINGLRSGNVTRGHRFMSNSPFSVSGFEDYRTKLRLGRVIIDSDERAQIIEAAAKKLASEAGLDLVEDKGLLIENAGLTEWPVPLLGSFDANFLTVPPEVIQLTMRTNQKYFALRNGETGALSNHFICTANIEASDGGKVIVEGNARVLAARLSDARFFWEQDRKKPLQDYLPKLEQIVFHEKLGTVADKVARVAKLARELAPACGADPDLAERAAQLCKADLVTGMVGEFPELQGVMGRYYADSSTLLIPANAWVHVSGGTTSIESNTTIDTGPRRYKAEGSNEHPDVARAIAEHYTPQGPSDACPTAPVSVAVALADKLDSISAFYLIGERSSGSKDPYAIRRAALGAIRLILENNVRISIPWILGRAMVNVLKTWTSNGNSILKITDDGRWEIEGNGTIWGRKFLRVKYPNSVSDVRPFAEYNDVALVRGWQFGDEGYLETSELPNGDIRSDYDDLKPVEIPNAEDSWNELVLFFADRLKVQQREQGVPHDLIDAVFALGGEDDLVRLLARVKALQVFLGSEDGKQLLAGYKRAANILKIEEKKDKRSYDGAVDAAKLAQGEETALHGALMSAQTTAASAVQAEQFEAAMAALAKLRGPIDGFFEKVIVNADDPATRANRLNLLAAIRAAVHTVADFSKIEG
jgi:glycyl-tRNA synthetase beta chain